MHRLAVLILAVTAWLGSDVAAAAPPPLATEHLEGLYRKTLDDYDHEIGSRTVTPLNMARSEYIAGLHALDKYDFVAARDAFLRSHETSATYCGLFNAALTYQLERDYSAARKLYAEAGRLEESDAEWSVNLAFVLDRQNETEQSMNAFEHALALALREANGSATEGRTLLQRALLNYRVGRPEPTLDLNQVLSC